MMMNFETVVRHYWPKALRDIKEDPEERVRDQEAIKAVTDRQLPISGEMTCVHGSGSMVYFKA